MKCILGWCPLVFHYKIGRIYGSMVKAPNCLAFSKVAPGRAAQYQCPRHPLIEHPCISVTVHLLLPWVLQMIRVTSVPLRFPPVFGLGTNASLHMFSVSKNLWQVFIFNMTSKQMRAKNCDMLRDIEFWTTFWRWHWQTSPNPLKLFVLNERHWFLTNISRFYRAAVISSNFHLGAPESEDCAQLQQWALVVWLSVTCFQSPVESLLTLAQKVKWCEMVHEMVQHTDKTPPHFIANFKVTHCNGLKFGGGASEWHQPKKLKERCWMHCILTRFCWQWRLKSPYSIYHATSCHIGFPARRWP